jgi:hypothetical protein
VPALPTSLLSHLADATKVMLQVVNVPIVEQPERIIVLARSPCS